MPAKDVARKSDGALVLSTEELRNIESFDDALALFNSNGGVVSAADLGDGFELLDDKSVLIGIPLLILATAFRSSEKFPGSVYAVCRVLARTPQGDRKFVFADGSTGIKDQLLELKERTGREAGVLVPGGLVRSDYTYDSGDGKKVSASTYYLSTVAG